MIGLDRVVTVCLAVAIAVTLWTNIQSRPVISFDARLPSEMVPAKVGDLGHLDVSYDVLRDQCRLNPESVYLWLRDASDVSFSVNQRRFDMPIVLSDGRWVSEMTFEVPPLATTGPALVQIRLRFECKSLFGVFAVEQTSPFYAFGVSNGP